MLKAMTDTEASDLQDKVVALLADELGLSPVVCGLHITDGFTVNSGGEQDSRNVTIVFMGCDGDPRDDDVVETLQAVHLAFNTAVAVALEAVGPIALAGDGGTAGVRMDD